MELLVGAINIVHVTLGWVSVALLAFMLLRKKGDQQHRRLGKATLVLTALMAFLAIAFVTYRLFGGQRGPAGFSILGVNKLAFPLYLFYIAYLLVRSATDDEARTKSRSWGVAWLVLAVTAGTVASVASGNRPYLTGRIVYTLEINLTDLIVSVVMPLWIAAVDLRWRFQDFSRRERIDQHGLRIVAGTVFLIYASAPWNYLTNGIYSAILGPLGLGHVLVYSGSPFLALYVITRYSPTMKAAVARLQTSIASKAPS